MGLSFSAMTSSFLSLLDLYLFQNSNGSLTVTLFIPGKTYLVVETRFIHKMIEIYYLNFLVDVYIACWCFSSICRLGLPRSTFFEYSPTSPTYPIFLIYSSYPIFRPIPIFGPSKRQQRAISISSMAVKTSILRNFHKCIKSWNGHFIICLFLLSLGFFPLILDVKFDFSYVSIDLFRDESLFQYK